MSKKIGQVSNKTAIWTFNLGWNIVFIEISILYTSDYDFIML